MCGLVVHVSLNPVHPAILQSCSKQKSLKKEIECLPESWHYYSTIPAINAETRASVMADRICGESPDMPWPLRMTLLIFFFALAFYIYVGWRLANAIEIILPEHITAIRRFVFLVFLFLSLFPLIVLSYHFAGALDRLFIFRTELHSPDYFLLYPFWIGLIAVLEVAPYFLLADTFHLTLRLFASNFLQQSITKLAVLKISVFALFLIYVGVRTYLDTNRVKVSQYEVSIKGLPESFADLTIGLISDVQIDRYSQDDKIRRFQRRLDDIGPDLLLFAGDLVTRGRHFIPQGVQSLCETKAKIDRIACVGDHDFWSGPEEVSSGLLQCGWKFLDNQHHVIQHESAQILVTGITHVYSKRIRENELNRLLSSAPDADVKILLVHQPATWIMKTAEKHGYHLLLAGHTHGGQIVFRPFGIRFTTTQTENPIYTGHEKVGNLNVIVTNGTGFTLAPIRYHAPAEVVRIRINKQKEEAD